MRYLLDTHIFIWHAREQYKLSPNIKAIIDDYANEICVSSESLKELVQLWNKKPHIQKWWKTPLELVRSVEDEYYFRVLYLHKEHYETYAKLRINEASSDGQAPQSWCHRYKSP